MATIDRRGYAVGDQVPGVPDEATGLIAVVDDKGTLVARTITGTANQITVTKGDGVAGNPTLSIPTAFQARERLSADRTYYVRKDGSDSNTGLVDNAGGAFLTIQKAVNTVADTLDLGTYAITIQVRAGTYAENVLLRQYIGRGTQGHTTPIIQGESSDHTLVNIAPASGVCVSGVSINYCEWTLKNLQITPTSNIGVLADAGSWICIDGLVFAGTATVHLEAEDFGIIEVVGNYTISAGAQIHVVAILNALVLYTANTVTLSGTPAFSTAFAYIDYNSTLQAASVTYSGAATGTRYIAQNSSIFHLAGADPNSVFPGNVNGAFTALPVAQGGTGGVTTSAARTALGLAIGSNVQAWDADLDTLAALGNWKVAYTNGSSAQTALALGAAGTVLRNNGVSAAPTMAQVTADMLAGSAFGAAIGMVNGTITYSVASNILTVNIKTLAGADPTATDPVYFIFRNATAATGDYTVISVTSALTITTNATGATLGTANSVPFRLWVVAFNNSGTTVLALFQSVTGGATPTAIAALNPAAVASSTAISGSATAAGTFYTPNGTTVTSKAFTILGYLDYASGLATAGTYASAPTTVQLFGPGIKKPGDVMQSVTATTSTITNNSTSTFSTTNLTLSIAPTAAPNLVRVLAQGTLRTDSGGSAGVTQIHRGSTAVGSVAETFGAGGATWGTAFNFVYDAPGTTSSTTYAVKLKNTDNVSQASYPKGNAADAAVIVADEVMT